MREVKLNNSDIKFCANFDGQTFGFALTADYANNSVDFFMIDLDTFETAEQGTFNFYDKVVDLQEKLEFLTTQLKQEAGDAVITIQ